jgi:uncharacterized caspase-like protein
MTYVRCCNHFRHLAAVPVLAVLGLASSAVVAQESGRAKEGFTPVEALQIVDCLLPGQVRQVGGRPYLTQRRPTRTTAKDCQTRGGEYLLYDRANYKSALNVWLPAAEQGNAEAQTMVGEIYERGLGAEPNYEAAIEWYTRAAKQNFSRAQFNLGTLYEQGLGVPADRLEALNWYRRAWGLPEDSLIYKSAAASESAELRAQLEAQISQRQRQIDALQKQVQGLQEKLRQQPDAAEQLDSLRGLVAQLEQQHKADHDRLDRLPAPVATTASTTGGGARPSQDAAKPTPRRTFGRYYALVIAVANYEKLERLSSPIADATRMKQLLEERYGFSVKLLSDPSQLQVMQEVNHLSETLTEDDNLLIYFAGHGNRLGVGQRETGYWLPTNADKPPDDSAWVPNEFVSRHLGRLNAKRVLVLSDSCYAGLLGDDPGYVMVGEGRYTDEYIKWKTPRRARLVIASGGDDPVLDEDGGGHSIFAHALLDELDANQQVLTAPELFLHVRDRIRHSSRAKELGQDPKLKVIKDAGHDVGDFFLVPG